MGWDQPKQYAILQIDKLNFLMIFGALTIDWLYFFQAS